MYIISILFLSTKPEALILSPEDIRLKCMPPEPLVKILQRPNQNGIRNGFVSNEGKPKQPVKSLQQVTFHKFIKYNIYFATVIMCTNFIFIVFLKIV